jgi:hypothetical protein
MWLLIQENYGVYRKPGVSHKDAMVILGQQFALVKLNKQ